MFFKIQLDIKKLKSMCIPKIPYCTYSIIFTAQNFSKTTLAVIPCCHISNVCMYVYVYYILLRTYFNFADGSAYLFLCFHVNFVEGERERGRKKERKRMHSISYNLHLIQIWRTTWVFVVKERVHSKYTWMILSAGIYVI